LVAKEKDAEAIDGRLVACHYAERVLETQAA